MEFKIDSVYKLWVGCLMTLVGHFQLRMFCDYVIMCCMSSAKSWGKWGAETWETVLCKSVLQDIILSQTCKLSLAKYYTDTFQAAAKHVSETFGFTRKSYLGKQKMTSSSYLEVCARTEWMFLAQSQSPFGRGITGFMKFSFNCWNSSHWVVFLTYFFPNPSTLWFHSREWDHICYIWKLMVLLQL